MKGLPDSVLVYGVMKATRHSKKRGKDFGFIANAGWDAMDEFLTKLEEHKNKKTKETK